MNLYKINIFCHHGDTLCHPNSSYVTTKLYGTFAHGYNNNIGHAKRAIFAFLTVDVGVRHIDLAVPHLDDACQIGDMGKLYCKLLQWCSVNVVHVYRWILP